VNGESRERLDRLIEKIVEWRDAGEGQGQGQGLRCRSRSGMVEGRYVGQGQGQGLRCK